MASTQDVPEELLAKIVSVFEPQQIILFGSRARGQASSDSDFDLVVVLDDDVPDDRLSARRRSEAHQGFPHPVDIIPCRNSVLHSRGQAVGSFAHTVLTEGLVIYERP